MVLGTNDFSLMGWLMRVEGSSNSASSLSSRLNRQSYMATVLCGNVNPDISQKVALSEQNFHLIFIKKIEILIPNFIFLKFDRQNVQYTSYVLLKILIIFIRNG
jgi:hypothetical protein